MPILTLISLDYTIAQENNLAEFKNDTQSTEIQSGGVSQIEHPTSFQTAFPDGIPTFEPFRERIIPSNIPTQSFPSQCKSFHSLFSNLYSTPE